MSNLIMVLFDEFQSKTSSIPCARGKASGTVRCRRLATRVVEAAEHRGHRTKKTPEIDPIQAETVRLIYRLAREGNGCSGSMGVKSIAKHLNGSAIRTRDGGRFESLKKAKRRATARPLKPTLEGRVARHGR